MLQKYGFCIIDRVSVFQRVTIITELTLCLQLSVGSAIRVSTLGLFSLQIGFCEYSIRNFDVEFNIL